jgi:hypothetical protein
VALSSNLAYEAFLWLFQQDLIVSTRFSLESNTELHKQSVYLPLKIRQSLSVSKSVLSCSVLAGVLRGFELN